ncbi:MAG TPA: hypothetical protein VHO47_00060 [Candidatus Babeliales bacterium]|nr:hypothetical protein [Candidatus Babeliales bacterium]
MKYAGVRTSLLFLSILSSGHYANAMTKQMSKYTNTFYKGIKGDHIRALVTTNVGHSVRIGKKRFFKKRGFGPKGQAVLFDPELSRLSRAVYLCINHKKTKSGNWDIGAKEQIFELPRNVHVPTVIRNENPFGIIKATTQAETSLD